MNAETVAVRICRLPHAEGLPLPSKGSAGAAGYDLRAAIDESMTIAAGARVAVPTGLMIELPSGWEGQVRPRSGMSFRHGITVVNAPGTIDSDYRGEISLLLVNLGDEPFEIHRGDRLAQLLPARVVGIEWHEVDKLSGSERGAGGFGSTGRD